MRPPASAFWIGSEHPFDLHEAYLCFRRGFHLARRPTTARLRITGDSRYRLWVNGAAVARGPARCLPQAQSVDTLEIAPYLQAGENLIGVQVYQPGYSHFAYVHRAAAGLLAWLECEGALTLASDGSWRVRRDPSFDALVPRVSIYGAGVEDRAMELDEPWQQPGYNDAAWARARVVAPTQGGYPWAELRARELPPLEERALPLALRETRLGREVVTRDIHAAIREGWAGATLHPLEADAEGWFSPQLSGEQAAFWLFDLSQDWIGQGWAEVAGAGGNETLDVSYAEKTRDGKLVLSDPATYCRVQLSDRFWLRAGAQVCESFSLRGGRYLLFRLAGPTGAGLRLRFHARASVYPLELARPFASDDPLLAEIAAMCERTFRACLADGFVDCVWRESSQWLGDALPQALIMASMSDDTRPLHQALRMAAEGAYPDGVLPGVMPAEVHAYTVVDYNFSWVELLALHQRLTGDDAFTRELWPVLVRMLERFARDLNGEGLIASQAGRRLFLDWSPQSRREPSAVYNLRYLLALEVAAELARAVELEQDARRWQGRAEPLRAAIREAFWHGGLWYDDRERTSFSQLAAALAVLAGCATAGEIPALLDAIVARSLDLDDAHRPGAMVLASPFMHHYLFEALHQHGRGGAVVDIIRARWGRWALAGEPTTWENWNVDFPDGSQCHAFSAHPRYHLFRLTFNL
jgi:hypothetical protein